MRRLLQVGTFLLMLSALVAPLLEYFDRWDAPGLGSDTEFAMLAVLVVLCLVLLVGLLVARRAADVPMSSERVGFADDDGGGMNAAVRVVVMTVAPMCSPPPLISLRI